MRVKDLTPFLQECLIQRVHDKKIMLNENELLDATLAEILKMLEV